MTLSTATIYVGNIVHSLDYKTLQVIPNGLIGVGPDGTILVVDKQGCIGASKSKIVDSMAKNDVKIDENDIKVVHYTKDQFIFPGFFDTHIHAAQYPNVGIFGETTLLDWLQKYTFPLESQFNNPEKAKEVYSTIVERTLSNGTTMASYYGTIHIPGTLELAKVCEDLGQRALVGRVCMERFCPDALVDENPAQKDIAFIKEVHEMKSDLVAPILTPRFAPSCTAETLAAQGKIAKELDVKIQTHLSENDREIAWIKELFPESKHYTDVYDEAGLMRKGSIFAHCIHLSEPERKLFIERGSGISHCPLSNMSIGSGIAPVLHMLKEGQLVSLGTDVSGGYSPSILVNARQAVMMSRELARSTKDDTHKLMVEHVFYLATLGGAAVCACDEELGNFIEGKKFDAQLIDVSAPGTQMDIFEWNTPQEPSDRVLYLATKWLYLGDDRNTRQVWVNGKVVVDKN